MTAQPNGPGGWFRSKLRDWLRLLTFRSTPAELHALGGSHLVLGLGATTLVGVARYWQDPYASLLQATGIASLIYVGALSALLWLLYVPLRLEAWSFSGTMTFVSLVSLPAALQAIPIPDRLDHSESLRVRACVLGLVTSWRAALLLWFLVRSAGLSPLQSLVSMLLPIDVIVIALGQFQVRHEIDQFVNGHRSLDVLLMTAVLALPLPLLGYAVVVVCRLFERRARLS